MVNGGVRWLVLFACCLTFARIHAGNSIPLDEVVDTKRGMIRYCSARHEEGCRDVIILKAKRELTPRLEDQVPAKEAADAHIAFYRSSGQNSGTINHGTWFPINGMAHRQMGFGGGFVPDSIDKAAEPLAERAVLSPMSIWKQSHFNNLYDANKLCMIKKKRQQEWLIFNEDWRPVDKKAAAALREFNKKFSIDDGDKEVQNIRKDVEEAVVRLGSMQMAKISYQLGSGIWQDKRVNLKRLLFGSMKVEVINRGEIAAFLQRFESAKVESPKEVNDFIGCDNPFGMHYSRVAEIDWPYMKERIEQWKDLADETELAALDITHPLRTQLTFEVSYSRLMAGAVLEHERTRPLENVPTDSAVQMFALALRADNYFDQCVKGSLPYMHPPTQETDLSVAEVEQKLLDQWKDLLKKKRYVTCQADSMEDE
eukprot:GILK01000879.1.p1 GENE.GILK01000879.1~~GILK01000879.1.p1  ORF type:complete len:426 (+),score=72.96 GILK01000879.1:51-1328(+)